VGALAEGWAVRCHSREAAVSTDDSRCLTVVRPCVVRAHCVVVKRTAMDGWRWVRAVVVRRCGPRLAGPRWDARRPFAPIAGGGVNGALAASGSVSCSSRLRVLLLPGGGRGSLERRVRSEVGLARCSHGGGKAPGMREWCVVRSE
jgi:hypothetical protein